MLEGKPLALLILSMPDPKQKNIIFLYKCNKPGFSLVPIDFFRDNIDHLRGILESILISMDLDLMDKTLRQN